MSLASELLVPRLPQRFASRPLSAGFGRFVGLFTLAIAVSASGALATAADRIVLRNLDILRDAKVLRWDPDGVVLEGGKRLAWDEIEKATLEASDKQADFDRYLQRLGPSLYRIRQRLKVGDYQGLAESVDQVYSVFARRRSPSAYMVVQAAMWARLAQGRREAALEPYLRCLLLLRTAGDQALPLPGTRRLEVDLKTGLTPELPPIWFDGKAAQEQLPLVAGTIAEAAVPWPPGARIYFAAMASAAGRPDTAGQVLRGVKQEEVAIRELRVILAAQSEVLAKAPDVEVAALSKQLDSISAANRPLALYWLGRARRLRTSPAESQRGMLQLLSIPALHGDDVPELAAAALHEAMLGLEEKGNKQGTSAIRREILDRYGPTFFGQQLKARLSPKDDSEGT